MAIPVSVHLSSHQHLPRLIAGRFLAAHPQGLDIEFVLDNRATFSLPWEDARKLVRLAGPNLSGLNVVYDGRSVVVGGAL